MTFELLVATRYLRAKRKQAMISVITVIAILGVSAGVAALVVAMAVSEGQRQDIRDRLLGAQAHVTIYPAGKEGILNYREVARAIETVKDVVGAAPHADQYMVITSTTLTGVRLTGIVPEMDSHVSLLSKNVIAGDLKDLTENTIAIGKELSESRGIQLGDRVSIMSATGTGGPSGMERKSLSFKVVAIFSIGLFYYDESLVYVPFDRAAYLIGAGDVATNIEVKTRDLDHSEEVGEAILKKLGPGFVFQDWKTNPTNKAIFNALKLERLGMAIAISLIVFVASLNIVATLVMMVLEKTRDIATLMAMGATLSQVRRIFMIQGVIIGAIGTTIGIAVGQGISYFADKYQLIPLDPMVYSISYLPFRADLWDSAVIAAVAILISFLATLYPSGTAARLQPVEALRYE